MPAAKTKKSNKAKQNAAAAKAKAEKARKAAIASGALIEGKGDVEYHRNEDNGNGTVEKRAAGILKALESAKTPVAGKDLAEKLGGGWPQYLSMFAMLKTQGLVVEYRKRTGKRGGSGVAYILAKNAK